MATPVIILGIESSCDETAAAVLVDGTLRSNVGAGQDVHAQWGGVVPELASRAHPEHIVPVVEAALRAAGVDRHHLSAIAFTQGPGLIGGVVEAPGMKAEFGCADMGGSGVEEVARLGVEGGFGTDIRAGQA